jgi:hypothetical protein
MVPVSYTRCAVRAWQRNKLGYTTSAFKSLHLSCPEDVGFCYERLFINRAKEYKKVNFAENEITVNFP